MEDSKLPHERLREWASKSEGNDTFPSGWLIGCLLGDTYNVPVRECERKAFRKLADEIERYYIARPRYEDGEPVQFGDEVELNDYSGCYAKGILQDLNVNRGTILLLSLTGADHSHVYRYDTECDTIKRHAPKVLDADGVPIEVGDVVWKLVDSTRWEVTKMHEVEPRIRVRQLDTDKCVEGGWFRAEYFSHREPDSLRKLIDDMMMYRADMTEEGSVLDVEIGEWTDRLTALMERGAE